MIVEASPNIAFIKYWGKLPSTRDEDRNLATNPSLSLTLSQARTRCSVRRLESHNSELQVESFLNGEPASPADAEKITRHIARILHFLGTENGSFRVDSDNNFPAGAGIASSASAFAALTCATLAELEAFPAQPSPEEYFQFSQLARRGSGSACRSLLGPYMLWEGSGARLFPCSWPLRDTILMVSRAHKKIPSSQGHTLAQSSPLFAQRLKRLPERLEAVKSALLEKNLQKLGPLLEQEALELHAIVESSPQQKVEYLLPETRKILALLQKRSSRDCFFTLDAGPNIHLISEKPQREEAERLLHAAGVEAEIWEDCAGFGPRLLPSP